ncbi:MAG TPA: zinc ABC transporter substrate-binding protein, partial [Alphaproteobacteria bacterium]|nr:zinc ABC transporter substrate-binding protein [Alphaproteobacteria bacterium]
ERRYGLTAVGAVAIDPERQPGVRHIAQLRRHLAEQGARCIFAEPQFPPDLVTTLREGTSLQSGTLDPLGSGLPAGPGQYESLMHGLAASLRACLGTS